MEECCWEEPRVAPRRAAAFRPGLSGGWGARLCSGQSAGTPAAAPPSAVWPGMWRPCAHAGPGSPSGPWHLLSVCTGGDVYWPEIPAGGGKRLGITHSSCIRPTGPQSHYRFWGVNYRLKLHTRGWSLSFILTHTLYLFLIFFNKLQSCCTWDSRSLDSSAESGLIGKVIPRTQVRSYTRQVHGVSLFLPNQLWTALS